MKNPLAPMNDEVSTAPAKEVEVLPGVMERRYFLRDSLTTAAAVFALAATPGRLLGQEPAKVTSPIASARLAWEEFLKQALPMAQQLIADPGFNFDEYLFRIGSLATRLKEIPDSKLGPYTSVDPRVWFGPSFRGSPFLIIQWRMEPGAFLPPHNHPNASVCTLGFEGEVQLRNFEIIGEAPDPTSKNAFRIRETRSERMTPGRISTLSPVRDNIHSFQVGKTGVRGIDINTEHPKNTWFSFLDMNDKPVDAEQKIYEVTWNPGLGQSKKK